MSAGDKEAFTTFILPARSHSQVWRLGFGLLIIAAVYYSLLIATLNFAAVLFSSQGIEFLDFDGTLALSKPAPMIAVLATFTGMLVGVLIAAQAMHRRGPATLIGPDLSETRGHFVLAIHVFFPILSLWLVVSVALYPPFANLPFGLWLTLLPLSIPLLFVQVLAEEIVFRGYLMQQLAVRFRSPFVWMLGPSLLFGLMHYSADQFGANNGLVVLNTTLFGLIMADLTYRTGNLGAAVGLHFMNNLFSMFLVTLSGSYSGLSLYVTPFGLDDTETIRTLLLLDMLGYCLAYVVFRNVHARLRDR